MSRRLHFWRKITVFEVGVFTSVSNDANDVCETFEQLLRAKRNIAEEPCKGLSQFENRECSPEKALERFPARSALICQELSIVKEEPPLGKLKSVVLFVTV